MTDKENDAKRAPATDTQNRQFGTMRETGQDGDGKKPEDVTDRKTAGEWVNPLDDSNGDPRVKEIRAAQEKEMAEYKKNYKKNVAKKSDEA